MGEGCVTPPFARLFSSTTTENPTPRSTRPPCVRQRCSSRDQSGRVRLSFYLRPAIESLFPMSRLTYSLSPASPAPLLERQDPSSPLFLSSLPLRRLVYLDLGRVELPPSARPRGAPPSCRTLLGESGGGSLVTGTIARKSPPCRRCEWNDLTLGAHVVPLPPCHCRRLRMLVHNGKTYTPVNITPEMVGHKVGAARRPGRSWSWRLLLPFALEEEDQAKSHRSGSCAALHEAGSLTTCA